MVETHPFLGMGPKEPTRLELFADTYASFMDRLSDARDQMDSGCECAETTDALLLLLDVFRDMVVETNVAPVDTAVEMTILFVKLTRCPRKCFARGTPA
jgi:hypothetical protein